MRRKIREMQGGFGQQENQRAASRPSPETKAAKPTPSKSDYIDFEEIK